MSTLELKTLSKSFGATEVLSNINLSIHDKEFVVFVGPSGCGKSTLLRIIAGLETASVGEIYIDQSEVSKLHPIDRGISMVFQSYALYPHLTVFENIAFPLRVQKLSKKEIMERVHRAADILQLKERLPFKPGQLSGGQRQRVAIGRSIVRNPNIFLFDEPLSNLDAALRGDMRVELAQLHKELQATMVYVTHDQVEAMTMADRIVVLNNGVVEQFGTPMDLYHHPQTRFVAGFIGQPNMNFVSGVVQAVESNGLRIELNTGISLLAPVQSTNATIGETVDVGIRPENLSASSGNVGLPLHVSVVEQLGSNSIVYGALSDGRKFCAAIDGNIRLTEDSVTNFEFSPNDVHVFNSDGQAFKRMSVPEPVVAGA